MLILVIYSALSLLLKRSSDSLNTFGNIVQCIVPLLANAGLLLNAGTLTGGEISSGCCSP